MDKILKQGRLLFAVALPFGVENLICARFGLPVRGVPWFPEHLDPIVEVDEMKAG